ncbi:MAG: serpin family protein [Solobacterium sp.]|nr:serpin family protein [Solobacterium sp.]
MKKEDLYKAVGDIPDGYINESEAFQKKRRYRRSLWLLPLAAAVAILLLWPKHTAPGITDPVLSPMVLAEAEMPEPLTDITDLERFQYSEDFFTWWEDFSKRRNASLDVNSPIGSFYENAIPVLLGNSTENRIVSPINIWMALAMLEETTAGNTQKEILQALGVQDTKQLRTIANAVWNACYDDTPALQCLLANSMWLNGARSFHTDTLKVLADTYKASSYAGDPSDPAFTKMFQDWLNKNTKELLKDAVSEEEFSSDMVLTLASSLYYKNSWAMRFNASLTDTQPFHTPEGTVDTEFLHNTDHYDLYAGNTWTAVCLPLADGGNMYIYLPDEGHTPEEVLRDPAIYAPMRKTATPANAENDLVVLSLPSFDISGSLDLCEILQELGIRSVFTMEADFSPLCDEKGLCVSDAHHAARLIVDEEGVTGAAYTEIAIAEGAIEPGETVEFTVDRPFAFTVVHADSSILFSGIVTHPEK